jgi:hypothetical protein
MVLSGAPKQSLSAPLMEWTAPLLSTETQLPLM